MSSRLTHLIVLGERDALRWVLRERRMAFPPYRRSAAQRLQPGDPLLLYVTRGAFHNPTRDRGRVIGVASVASPVVDLDDPLTLVGRTFTTGCRLDLKLLCPRGEGVELAPLVEELSAFPIKHAWSAVLRRAIVPLPQGDATRIKRLLAQKATEVDEAITTYLYNQRE